MSFILSLLFCLSVIALTAKNLAIWQIGNLVIFGSAAFPLFLGAVSAAALIALRLKVSISAWLLSLWIIFFSDWLVRPYNFLQGPQIRGEIILFSILGYFLIRSRRGYRFLNYLPFAAAGICFISFFAFSAGRLIFSDDHTVFLFRLQLLKENFPFIPFYYPLWNAGIDQRDFFATGSLNVFTIFSPLIYLFPMEKVYNILIALLLFVFHPFLMYIAAKFARLRSPGPAIAATLSLCLGLHWYRWALQYGTLGFLTSLALVPLNVVLVAEILKERKDISLPMAAFFVVTVTLMLFWSLSGLIFLPAIVYALWNVKKILAKRKLLVTGFLILLINLPWIYAFWSVSKVGKFIERGGHPQAVMTLDEQSPKYKPEGIKPYLRKALQTLRDTTTNTNPIFVTIGLLSLLLYRSRSKWFYIVTCGWLFIMGIFIYPLNPRLELERMLIVLTALTSIPLAQFISGLVRGLCARKLPHPPHIIAAPLLGFLMVSPLSSGSIVLNRSLIKAFYSGEDVDNMRKMLNEHVEKHGTSQRLLFSGFVLHELGGGHLAPLTIFSKVPLVASSHVHNVWRYRQVFPAEFLQMEARGENGVKKYLDLFNAGHVFAHEPEWLTYFSSRPEEYLSVWQSGKFTLFKRLDFEATYFLEGRGEILSQNTSSIRLKLQTPNATIKFTHFDFLTADTCRIMPHEVGEGINFIKLADCPVNEEIVIKSVILPKRLAGGL